MTRFARRVRDLPTHTLGIIGGALVWCLLWGEFSVLSIVGGLLLGAAIYVMFPAPPLSREVTLRLSLIHI